MPRNGNIDIESYPISKGTRPDGEELIIIKLIVTKKKGDNTATVYIGKAEDNERFFVLKGNMHVVPFIGKDAARAAKTKAIKRIKEIHPEEVFGYLARQ